MVDAEQIIFAVNTSGTLVIGGICLLMVSTTLRDLGENTIKEFTRRLRLAILVLIVYVSYYAFYRTFAVGSAVARLPLYFLLIAVFTFVMWAVMGFEGVADTYGVSNTEKLERARNQEDM
nr:MAG: hypothetical protein J07AB56_01900 [Candidatus Nanosalinarum sp. J07AB56]